LKERKMVEEKEDLELLMPKYELSEIGPCKYRLRVEVSWEKIKERLERRYKDLLKEVTLPGFRKGKVPRRLLERKFGKEIMEDLKYELLSDSYEEVKKERNFKEIGTPEINMDQIMVKEETPFSYEMTFEVMPSFDLPPYKGIKLKKPKVEVSEDEVEKFIENLRENQAEYLPLEEGVVEDGDLVICDLSIKDKERIIKKFENTHFVAGKTLLLEGKIIPGIEKEILQRKVGEELRKELSFPQNHHDPALKGKAFIISIILKAIKRKNLPELTEEWVKGMGFESIQSFKEQAKKDILHLKEEALREELSRKIIEQLVQNCDFPLPEQLIKNLEEELLNRARLRFALSGETKEKIQEKLEKLRESSRELVIKELKGIFIMGKIADEEKIFVTEDEIEERISLMAAQANKWPHEIREDLEKENLIPSLRRSMREDKVRQVLLSWAELEDS
jgi:trigger factor